MRCRACSSASTCTYNRELLQDCISDCYCIEQAAGILKSGGSETSRRQVQQSGALKVTLPPSTVSVSGVSIAMPCLTSAPLTATCKRGEGGVASRTRPGGCQLRHLLHLRLTLAPAGRSGERPGTSLYSKAGNCCTPAEHREAGKPSGHMLDLGSTSHP